MLALADRWIASMRPALPRREFLALKCALSCLFPYQLEWLLDWSSAAILVKSRRIGGSWTYALKACVLAMFAVEVSVVSVGERESLKFLRDVERHAQWLAALGSHWARPARRTYRTDLVVRLASGGSIHALPSSNAARGMGGSVILDEFAYHQDQEKVWEASAAATLHGGMLNILSTPNGIGGLFHDLATSTDADWRRHAVTLSQARAQGLRISDKKIRQIDRGNPQLHSQLFECGFHTRGDALFVGVSYFDALPTSYRVSIGVDFAYSIEQAADYCVAVVLAEAGGKYFVLRVDRAVTRDFTPNLRALMAAYPGTFMHWHAGPSEQLFGAQLLRAGLPVLVHSVMHGQGKYARSLNAVAAWNAGDVRVPRTAPWVSDFVSEASTFTGAKKQSTGQHDDQIDAFCSAFEALREGAGVGTSEVTTIAASFSQSPSIAVRNVPALGGSGGINIITPKSRSLFGKTGIY